MSASDALKSFRQGDYGKSEKPEDKAESTRVLKLSEEEQKELGQYQAKPGEEITCEISGKLEGDHFHVMSVRSTGGEPKAGPEDIAKIAGVPPPMMNMQTQPSPS